MKLAEPQARLLLSQARVARLATVSAQGRPHIVPVTFAVESDVIYTAVDAKPKSTRDLQRLRNLTANPRVTVLADHYDEDWRELWWVRADGTASILSDPAAMAGPVELLARRYQQYQESGPAGPVIAIDVDHWTAWSAR